MRTAYLTMGAICIIALGALATSERTITAYGQYKAKGLTKDVAKNAIFAFTNAVIYVFTGVSLILFAMVGKVS